MRIGTSAAFLLSSLCIAVCSHSAWADTDQVRARAFVIDEGVEFLIANDGADSFLFSWTDDTGMYIDIPDPTLILVEGQTYTFRRTTEQHPLVLTDAGLPISGSADEFARDTTDGDVIDTHTLKPIEDFTADPAPTDDFISWTPASGGGGYDQELVYYFYTCRVAEHTEMTGRIAVRGACMADWNNSANIDTQDVIAFLNQWLDRDPVTDIDANDRVDTADLLGYLDAWSRARLGGC